MSPYMRLTGRTQMMRMQMRRAGALAAQVLYKKALTLPTATLTGAATLIAGPSGVS